MGIPAAPLSYDEYRARKYMPELDGVRAISILLVIKAHMTFQLIPWLPGYVGVVLFFVLSGYLITTLALREEEDRGRVSLGAFYLRRCFRIFPLFYVTLTLYCLLIFGTNLKPSAREPMMGILPAYLFYLQEVPVAFRWFAEMPFEHAWSLGIEEKFYLVWPFIAFVWLRGRIRGKLAATLLLIACFAALPFLGAAPWIEMLRNYYHLLLGCLLAQLLHDRRAFAWLSFSGHPLATAGALLSFACAYVALPYFIRAGWGPCWELVLSLTATLVLTSLLVGRGWFQIAMRWRPLVFIGTLSYGMYLIHLLTLYPVQRVAGKIDNEIVRSLINYAGAIAAATVAAYVLALLVERPLIRWGRRLSEKVQRRGGLQSRQTHAADKMVS